jgi:hypothetical protein
LELKEGFEMKTSTGIEKPKFWISENLGTKMATRLFRGLALGVLLAAATGIYFSINHGEAGSPSSGSEITQAFEVEELEAPVIGVPAYLSSKAAVDFEIEELEAPVIGVPAYLSSKAAVDFEVEELEAAVIGVPAYLSSEASNWDEVEELESPVIGIPAYLSGRTAGSPLSREQMAARVEAERLEDPDLDGVLFDILMGPPVGR